MSFNIHMNIKYYLTLPMLLFSVTSVFAADELKTEKQKLSYALGTSFVINILQQDSTLEVDIDSLNQGMQDVLQDNPLQMSIDEMSETLKRYQETIVKKVTKMNENNKKAGEDFLANNKHQDGVKTTASGLQYKVLEAGSGNKPVANSNVTVHYHGSLIDGTVFDSSYQRGEPATFKLSQVIAGWQEALILMSEGSKWQVFIPAELAYGDRGSGAMIQPSSALIFDIELISIN